MIFFSAEFAIIFLCFFCIYWLIKNSFRLQNYLILFFNYFLIYTFSPYFTFVVLFQTCFVSYFGLFIHYKKSINALFSALFFTLTYLCFFKYYDFIYADFKNILEILNFEILAKNLDIVFPIGISFYTFASITYLVSIQKKELKPANFITLACYLSFFATLLAGPIARASFLLPQFEKKRVFKNADIIYVLLFFGIIKKILIANYLHGYVGGVFSDPNEHNMLKVITAVYLYGVWLYCDFSGYIDIVTALALAIGFTLPINFNMPYASLNLKEFWAKWHISLSTFIKDYIYIPLGGNKKGYFFTQINVIIAFALSGIWHGVGLNFLIWGLMHGVGINILNTMQKFRINISSKMPHLSMFITYSFVSIAWVYFDRDEISEANNVILSMFNTTHPITNHDIMLIFALIILFFIYPKTKNIKEILINFLAVTPAIFKPIVFSFILAFVFAIMPDGIPDFIYSSF